MEGRLTRHYAPRLIDADSLKLAFIGKRYGTQAIEYVIDQQPTVEAEPIRRGQWIDEQKGRWIYAKCSLCNTVHDVRSNYCPTCGAMMSEVKDV